MAILAVLSAAFFFPAPPGLLATLAAPTTETLSAVQLARGRWALLFVVVPGCPACEEAILWLGQAANVFPKIRFALVAPEITAELALLTNVAAPWVRIVLDRGGALGGTFGVRRAPTVILLVEGTPAGRLDWPFSEQDLSAAFASSLLEETVYDLVGVPAPDFVTHDLEGTEVRASELSRPLLLVFFNPGCPPCWEVLPGLAEISREVAVAVLAFVLETGLSPADRGRLEGFVQAVQGYPRLVLLIRNVEIMRTYGVTKMPSYILIGRKGVVIWVSDGPKSDGDLQEAVRAALAEGK